MMLIRAERSGLLVVDVQERLLPALHRAEQVLANCIWLVQIAQRLNVPVLLSEQYPKGLGLTVAELRERVPESDVLEKLCFSCIDETHWQERIEASGRRQWVLVGAEAHVCVLQTALGLVQAGKEVYVVADAVASRTPENRELALARLRAEGVRIVSREMVAFEWLGRAGSEQFRAISREFLR